MKKIFAMLVVCILALSSILPVYAADGKVTYSGNAGNFVFEPGSEHSLTDLFPNFKGVMPGDTLTQKITVKNNADNKVKVKIYIRSLGAHEDSAEFLSQLGLKVQKSEDNEMAYMFDSAANETAQLADWVCLGKMIVNGYVEPNVNKEGNEDTSEGTGEGSSDNDTNRASDTTITPPTNKTTTPSTDTTESAETTTPGTTVTSESINTTEENQ